MSEHRDSGDIWAHSANDHGHRHRLVDHAEGTGDLAGRFAEPLGLGELARWAGLIHDCGKGAPEWQAGLLRAERRGGRVGLDHKSVGARLALDADHDMVALAVAGHHGGLTSPLAVERLLYDNSDEVSLARAGAAVERMRSLVPEAFARVPSPPDPSDDPYSDDFLTRFLYSCLVDADALDTQAHRQGWSAHRLGQPLDADVLWKRFEQRRRDHLGARLDEPMAPVREEVFQACLRAAERGPGIFRLTAPTGSAKTIGVAGFGLRHAAAFGKSRVIVAVPFTTITSQNAAVYRELLDPGVDEPGEPVVLEHHSQVDLDDENGAHESWRRQAAENWDAPWVVTTTVQLLESLFGRKPSRMRKVHRLANAVVVLDEVQALPHSLLPVIADGLRLLATRFGTTVLLSSATQPELWEFGPLKDLPAQEIMPDPSALFARLPRVRYEWRTGEGQTLRDVVAEAVGHERVLFVVNTIKDALAAYRIAVELRDPGSVRHLSTLMCPAHRDHVLGEVKAALKADEPMFLVSTSLVEAGVDLDFPRAYRADGPPESIAQVGGRCNRAGARGQFGGTVVVFRAEDTGMPPLYKTQIGVARHFFGPGRGRDNPEDPVALTGYFRRLYEELGIGGRDSRAAVIQRNRAELDFLAVTDGPLQPERSRLRDRRCAFRMIDSDTVPVVVPYAGPDGLDDGRAQQIANLVAAVRAGSADPRALRRLQPFTTAVRRDTRLRGDIATMFSPVIGDLVWWTGDYSPHTGLVLDPSEEDFIA